MIRTRLRRYLFGVLGLALATAGHAQTLEVFAGGKRFVDSPALETPLQPGPTAFGPDGNLYVINHVRGALLRFDLLNGTASEVPTPIPVPGPPIPAIPHTYQNLRDVMFGADGLAYAALDNRVVRLDFAFGSWEHVAGGGYGGTRDCNGYSSFPVQFRQIADIAPAPFGRIFVVDSGNHNVCVASASGSTSRLAGGSGYSGFSGDGGPAEYATLNWPMGVTSDAAGNVFIADTGNQRIRKISADDGTITTIAGTGAWGFNGDGIPASAANLNMPTALALDSAGNLFFYDNGDIRVRRIDADTGLISTVAGTGDYGASGDGGPATAATMGFVDGLSVAANGDLYISDTLNQGLRRVAHDTGIITTVLGNGEALFCGEGAPRRETCLDIPQGVAVDAADNVFIADTGNGRIRRVSATTGVVTTIAGHGGFTEHGGDGGPSLDATFAGPAGLALDGAGNLYIAAAWDHRVRRIDAVSGVITTIAGTGTGGFAGDGGPATAAMLNLPDQLVVDAAGNVYFSDLLNNRVRKIAAGTGLITTVAGNGLTTGPLGDGGAATLASLYNPQALALDAAGNLLIADSNHFRVRKVAAASGIITTVAGNGAYELSGDGGPATAAGIGMDVSLATDPAGNIFLTSSYRLRRIDAATGIIDRVSPEWVFATPEGHQIQGGQQLAFDSTGRLYIADGNLNLVLRVSGLELGSGDTTPPVINLQVIGTEGNGGWYRSNVEVSWTISDAESAVDFPTTGCTTSTVTSDTAGITFTCAATSAGGTASRSVTIKRDTVAPALTFGAAAPAADAAGWHATDVSVPFTASDALSGVYSTSGASPVSIAGEGSGLSAQVVVTDFAGNSATFTTPTVNIDRSPPVIASHVAGTTFFDGWYVGNAQVTWTVNDAHSPVSSTSGCGPSSVTEDTAGITFTCTATSSGGSTSTSVVVKRDSTPPTVTFGSPTPAPGANGWYNSAVSIPYTVTDALSGEGFSESTNPVVFTTEGAGLTRRFGVRDAARNWVTVETPPINIDLSPPSIQLHVSGTPGTNGWYTSDVQVSWSVDETPANILASSGCESAPVTTDTAGVTFTCSVTSGGGTASSSVTIKRDATAPLLTFGTPTPAPNANGWNKTNVSVSFTRSDALSGLASTSATSPLVLSTEGAGVIGQVVVTDSAGNAATFSTPPRNIDKTVPYAEIATPVDGATYGFYSNLIADFVCADISLLSCTAPTVNGGPISTTTAGARTFKVTAKDLVSFTTTHTHSFTVTSQFNFDAFLAPANPPPTLNLVTHGALVPIRWQLPDGNGGFVSNPASFVSATVGALSCGSAAAVPLNDTASGPAGIGFDTATGTFTYNWATNSGWTGCRKLTIKLKDNSLHELRFKFQ